MIAFDASKSRPRPAPRPVPSPAEKKDAALKQKLKAAKYFARNGYMCRAMRSLTRNGVLALTEKNIAKTRTGVIAVDVYPANE